MPLTLLVPDLFPPAAFPTDWPSTPGLDTLLSKGRLERGDPMTQEDWLLNAFSLRGAPVAALRRLSARAELMPESAVASADADHWLCADPVHLRIERDHLQLISAAQFTLTAGEAEALVRTLNPHLAQDGLEIRVISPTEWIVHVAATAPPATTPLWRVADKSIFEHLPGEAGGIDWKRLGNEIQMLLHEHPVNVARESRGEPPISSVWFWGGDALTAEPGLAPEFIYSEDTLTRGLAVHGKSEYRVTPPTFAHWYDSRPEAGMSLVVLDDLSRAVRAHDAAGWRAALETMERNWFQPVMQAVWDKRLPMVRAVFPGERHTQYLHLARLDLWKLWRSRRPAHLHG
ncbi:MAG: hypothetical protein JNM76_00980 [Betaproteobacteria bacterium]|nr:hypothetical protein [Betaproteobacteria bacterium]